MLCQYGYFFPVNDSKTLTLKDDSSLYRFQVSCDMSQYNNIVFVIVVYLNYFDKNLCII